MLASLIGVNVPRNRPGVRPCQRCGLLTEVPKSRQGHGFCADCRVVDPEYHDIVGTGIVLSKRFRRSVERMTDE